MDWKNAKTLYKLAPWEKLMGALKKTGQSFSRLFTAYDGSTFRYSEPDRHENFVRELRNGPQKDLENFNSDIKTALAALSGLIRDTRK